MASEVIINDTVALWWELADWIIAFEGSLQNSFVDELAIVLDIGNGSMSSEETSKGAALCAEVPQSPESIVGVTSLDLLEANSFVLFNADILDVLADHGGHPLRSAAN